MILISFFFRSFSLMLTQNEEKFIQISELESWNIVDRKFLIHIFWQYNSIVNYLVEHKVIRWKEFFNKFQNPINEKTKKTILKIYESINDRNEKEKNWYTQIYQIKIFKTFWFWLYIFLAFLTYCFYEIFLRF
jgi:cytidylate kinase